MGRTLGWSVYLACSWTWCIGMFLPSLLMRDGGAPFFWAFFIPNVLGAASVGWVLSDRDHSRRFARALRPILLTFTAITVSFHAFWLAWRIGDHVGAGLYDLPLGVLLGASVVANAAAARRRVDWLPAVVTLCFTVIAGVCLLARPASLPPGTLGLELVGMSMVTILGFGLCPYLDVTFLRATQHAARPRFAFSIGFFLVFAFIILTATRGRVVWMPDEPALTVPENLFNTAVGCHFGAQAMFTVMAHIAALRRSSEDGSIGPRPPRPPSTAGFVFWPVIVGLALGSSAFWIPVSIGSAGLDPMGPNELVYRGYLGCYGLVFPAWMLLSLGGRRPMSRRTLSVLVVTCLIAAPFYWIGTIERQETWLIPGVVIVLLSRLFADRPRRRHEAA